MPAHFFRYLLTGHREHSSGLGSRQPLSLLSLPRPLLPSLPSASGLPRGGSQGVLGSHAPHNPVACLKAGTSEGFMPLGSHPRAPGCRAVEPDLRSGAWVVPVFAMKTSLEHHTTKHLAHSLHSSPLLPPRLLLLTPRGRTRRVLLPHSFTNLPAWVSAPCCGCPGPPPPSPRSVLGAQRGPEAAAACSSNASRRFGSCTPRWPRNRTEMRRGRVLR